MKLIRILTFLQFITFIPGVGQQNSILDARLLVSEFVIKNNIPGLSITITKNDNIIWSEGFGYAFLDTAYLTAETIEELQAPQQTSDGEMTNYGMGWQTYRWNGREWLGHSGGSVGGTTIFILSEEEDLVLAMVANLSDVNYNDLHFKVADLFTKN